MKYAPKATHEAIRGLAMNLAYAHMDGQVAMRERIATMFDMGTVLSSAVIAADIRYMAPD